MHIGLRVLNTTDLTVWKVVQIWRMDRSVQLVHRDTGARLTVAWTDLYRGYEAIQPFGAQG